MFVSLYPPTHNWHTRGLHIILVPEDKFQSSTTALFLEGEKLVKVVSIITITFVDNSFPNELPHSWFSYLVGGVLAPGPLLSSRSWSTVTKGGHSWSSTTKLSAVEWGSQLLMHIIVLISPTRPVSCQVGLHRSEGETMIPWKSGKSLVWDATCPTTPALLK